ncbi:hypothetical protein ZWY2020_025944 [Hordeum vulgare]|nr:hypothetical protein ZWY2020_025944 [Hordeum vulgare]
MDLNNRRRLDGDRLGDLPDCLLQLILSFVGSRQAMQTSVLSRRWRHLWRNVPCADIDEREFIHQQWEVLEDFADHVLTSIPPGMQLDAFRLHLLTARCNNDTASRWIRRGLRHAPAAVQIHAAQDGSRIYWEPCHWPTPTLGRYTKPDMSVKGSCAAGYTRRLTTLCLVRVDIMLGFMEGLGAYCPVLEELHVERCDMYMHTIDSPTLKSLAVIDPLGGMAMAAPLKLTTPRLASLRLDIPCSEEHNFVSGAAATQPVLTTLVKASVRLTNIGVDRDQNRRAREKRKLEFLRTMPAFLPLFSNAVDLHLQGFTTTALLDQESQEFPLLYGLRSLLMENCDLGLKFQALKSILRNAPNMEKLRLHLCTFIAPATPKKRKKMASSKLRGSAPVVSWCEKLKLIDIEYRYGDETHIDTLLSEISKGMPLTRWQQVKTKSVMIWRTRENSVLSEDHTA